MANGIWCGCCNDTITRQAVKNARITVTNPANGNLLALYKDREGTQPIGNPFLTREDGLIKFFCRTGRINISAIKGNSEHVFENEIVLDYAAPGDHVCGNAPGIFDGNLNSAGGGEIPTDEGIFVAGSGSVGYLLVLAVWVENITDTLTVVEQANLMPVYELTDGTGALRLFVADHLVGGEILVTNIPVFAYDLFQLIGMAPAAEQPESIAQGSGSGELRTITAVATCEFAYGVGFLASPAGYANPTPNAFGMSGGGASGYIDRGVSNEYFGTDQAMGVAVGSGDIYGVIASLLTRHFAAATLTIAFDNEDATYFNYAFDLSDPDSAVVTLYAQTKLSTDGGDGWGNYTNFYPVDTGFGFYKTDFGAGDYDVRVIGLMSDGSTVFVTSNIEQFTVAAMVWGDNHSTSISLSSLVVPNDTAQCAPSNMGNYRNVLSLQSNSTGKRYFEINFILASGPFIVGVGTDSTVLDDLAGSTDAAFSFYIDSGTVQSHHDGYAPISVVNPGFDHDITTFSFPVVCMAVDFDAGNLWLGYFDYSDIAGTLIWVGASEEDIAAGDNPFMTFTPNMELFAVACLEYDDSKAILQSNANPSIPTGFLSWVGA